MVFEVILGACAGALAYAAIRKAFDSRTEMRAIQDLNRADQLLKKKGFSYVWYDAEAGSDEGAISDALLLIATKSDRIVVTSSGHLVGAFYPTDSLHSAATIEKTPPADKPKLRLVVSNGDRT